MIETPEGVPMLAQGSHHGPREGACLMEYVSVLAGLPFDDHPRCTDPVLAAMARQVNDAASDAGRQHLASLAPQLAASTRIAPDRVAAMLDLWARAARQTNPLAPEVRDAIVRIERRTHRYRSETMRRGWRRVYSRLARLNRHPWGLEMALHRLARAIADQPDRDARLWALLNGCLQQAQPPEQPQGQADLTVAHRLTP